MIIAKELIDASINSKNAAQAAYEKALLEAILSCVGRVEALTSIILDIMDTYRYLNKQDDGMGTSLWSIMCHDDKDFDLDFCNAILDKPGGKCGVRPYYARKNCFGNIYVTQIGVFFGPDHNTLYPLSELKDRLQPKDYQSMLNAMNLLIEAVPAYKERLITKLNGLLAGEKARVSSAGKVEPK